MSNQPYIELSYIRSTGTQFINTNYYVNSNTRLEFKAMCTDMSVSGKWQQITGARNSYHASSAIQCSQNTTSHSLAIDYGTNGISNPPSFNENEPYEVIIANQNIYINNIKYNQQGTFSGTSSYPLWIFDENDADKHENYFIGRLYYYKIYEDNTLIKDFIPVKRTSDNKICLYDKVSETFFENAGTGEFIGSDEISYIELEYVETTGKQFVDLNYKTKANTGFEIDVNVFSNTGNNLFGATNDVNTRYPFFNLRGSGSPETVNRIYRYSYDNGSNNKMIDFQTSIDNKRHKFKVIRDDIYSYYTDDELLGTVTMEHPLNARWVLFSFRDYNGGTIRTSLSETCKCKFYNMKIYEDTNIVMNLIPVKRTSDNKICLFDTISCNYLLNIGSEEFIAGNPKNTSLETKVEYLEETKNLIKEAIINKGQTITANDTFRDYVVKVNAIELGMETQEEYDYQLGILNDILPDPYIQLEYIQSTGTQYINTQIFMNGTTNFEVDYEISSVVTWGALLGTDNMSSGIYYYGISNNNSINSNYLHIGNNETHFSNSIAQLNLLTNAKYTSSNRQLVVTNTNGTLTQNHSYSSISSSQYPIFIFALNRKGTPADISKLKLHHLIISDENGIKGNFIPVKRKSDNVICLYDKVSETFFTNAGTGEFIAGPEI